MVLVWYFFSFWNLFYDICKRLKFVGNPVWNTSLLNLNWWYCYWIMKMKLFENDDFFLQCTSLTPTPCFQQRCRNTEPGFQCLACPLGYVGTYEDALSFNISRRTFQLYNTVLDPTQAQTCSDINECLSDNGGCDANSYCTNTPVSLSHTQREREWVQNVFNTGGKEGHSEEGTI